MWLCNSLNFLNDYFAEFQDPRLRAYPLTSFSSQLYLILIYLAFVKILGPQLMKNHQAFTLRKTLIAYNFLQVIANVYLFTKGGKQTYLGRYSFWCQPEDDPNDPAVPEFLRCSWLLFISKWTDCLDTIFFVLRKKNNQISFLHVFHHGIMPVMTWIGITFFLGGHATFAYFINIFIHIVMYSYYMLSAFGPNMQRILNPYKKYLTIMQIIQFVIIIFHATVGFVNGCEYRRIILFLELFYGTFFLVLFCNFYRQAYMKKGRAKNK